MPTDPIPSSPARGTPATGALMAGVVLDATGGKLAVTVDALDGGARARAAFGYYPDAQAEDRVQVALTATGGLAVLAWEPAG